MCFYIQAGSAVLMSSAADGYDSEPSCRGSPAPSQVYSDAGYDSDEAPQPQRREPPAAAASVAELALSSATVKLEPAAEGAAAPETLACTGAGDAGAQLGGVLANACTA